MSQISETEMMPTLSETEMKPKLSETEMMSQLSETEMMSKLSETEMMSKLSETEKMSNLSETEKMSNLSETEMMSKLSETERMSKLSETEMMTKLSGTISCTKCNINFSKRYNLYKHLRKFHPEENQTTEGTLICGICSGKFQMMIDLHIHISSYHKGIDLKFEEKTFYCFPDFYDWKSEIELDSQSSFVVKNKIEKVDGSVVTLFECHRSGKPQSSRSRGVRRPKKSGSIKIGATCPAMMKVTCNKHELHEAIEIFVSYQSTHVGHETEVRKLRLQPSVRSALAAELNRGVSETQILNQIAQEFSPNKRKSLITVKDLWNIKRDFHVESNWVKAPNDFISNILKTSKESIDEKKVSFIETILDILEKFHGIESIDTIDKLHEKAKEMQALVTK